MPFSHVVEPGSPVKLKSFDPDETKGLEKEGAKKKTDKLAEEIEQLQELMYAARDMALLLVFQGMDTSGKDGAINRVLKYVNVQSCRVVPFKVPSTEELAHDFLWRIHREAPETGGITLFNRSHYEDVLVVRVHELAPKEIWQERFDQINAFEKHLVDNKTTILKFFLHISKEEQEQRLLEREKDPTKAWKLSAGDWKERELWDHYQAAYEDAISKCSTKYAPWRIVPANHKWFRDLAIAEAIADTLRPFRKQWMKDLEEMGKKAMAEIEEYRSAH
jgi:PPK2 family polyphosphate:nucleotide phosphotransferase